MSMLDSSEILLENSDTSNYEKRRLEKMRENSAFLTSLINDNVVAHVSQINFVASLN